MELNENINQLLIQLASEKERNQFENYIEYIQFLHYKALQENSRIDFSFPLTILVGKNGTGKSSILHAIYGTPDGKSTGDYWFSTSVDPIKENENKYFYGYTRKVNHEIIIKEAIKTRQKSKKDPDYWETDRPNPNIGMKEDNNLDTKTRNHPVTKNVVYFDFRSELSSFDKYFHFYKSKNDKKIRDKEKKLKETKNYIRKKSSLLKDAFNGKFVSFPRYPNNILNEECIIIDKTQNRELETA